jgi:uncharacterized protein YicC (UPF0701 family)
MARVNLKGIEKLIAEATAAAVTKLVQEREMDAQHIQEHVAASEDMIKRLEALESMIRDLVLYEKERIKALKNHIDDIKTEEPARIEAGPHLKAVG